MEDLDCELLELCVDDAAADDCAALAALRAIAATASSGVLSRELRPRVVRAAATYALRPLAGEGEEATPWTTERTAAAAVEVLDRLELGEEMPLARFIRGVQQRRDAEREARTAIVALSPRLLRWLVCDAPPAVRPRSAEAMNRVLDLALVDLLLPWLRPSADTIATRCALDVVAAALAPLTPTEVAWHASAADAALPHALEALIDARDEAGLLARLLPLLVALLGTLERAALRRSRSNAQRSPTASLSSDASPSAAVLAAPRHRALVAKLLHGLEYCGQSEWAAQAACLELGVAPLLRRMHFVQIAATSTVVRRTLIARVLDASDLCMTAADAAQRLTPPLHALHALAGMEGNACARQHKTALLAAAVRAYGAARALRDDDRDDDVGEEDSAAAMSAPMRAAVELAALLERLTDGWVIDALRAAAAKEQGAVASTALGALVEALSVK